MYYDKTRPTPQLRKHRRRTPQKVPIGPDQPHVVFHIGRKKLIVTAADLDASQLDALRAKIGCARKIRAVIHALRVWPDQPRWLMFSLLAASKDLTVELGGKIHGDLSAAVLASMVPDLPAAAQETLVKAAIETAALTQGSMPDLAAGRIAERMRQVKFPPMGVSKIARKITELSGRGDGKIEHAKTPSPESAAAEYLTYERKAAGVDEPDTPVHLFFRGEHYRWDGERWHRLSDDC